MKKIYTTIIASSILLIIIILIFQLFYQKNKYEKRIEYIEELMINPFYESFYCSYINFTYMNDIKSMEDIIESRKPLFPEDEVEAEIAFYTTDVLSKKGNTLYYYPIYNMEGTDVVSFILLSTGIDGKRNTFIKDTLYINTWYTEMDLYNFEDALNELTNTVVKRKSHFSFYDLLFGKKDYLVKFGCYERLVELGYAKDYFAGRGGPLTPID